jgi:hypothetical protein
MTQGQVAALMGTTQSVVLRLACTTAMFFVADYACSTKASSQFDAQMLTETRGTWARRCLLHAGPGASCTAIARQSIRFAGEDHPGFPSANLLTVAAVILQHN